MKKLIAKIREWLRKIIREEMALVITEFREIKAEVVAEEKKITAHWRADEATSAADHSLKLEK